MPIQFDYETDTLYLRGNEKGRDEGRDEERVKIALRLWQNGVEPSMIANVVSLPIEQVERIIAEYQGENSGEIAKK